MCSIDGLSKRPMNTGSVHRPLIRLHNIHNLNFLSSCVNYLFRPMRHPALIYVIFVTVHMQGLQSHLSIRRQSTKTWVDMKKLARRLDQHRAKPQPWEQHPQQNNKQLHRLIGYLGYSYCVIYYYYHDYFSCCLTLLVFRNPELVMPLKRTYMISGACFK